MPLTVDRCQIRDRRRRQCGSHHHRKVRYPSQCRACRRARGPGVRRAGFTAPRRTKPFFGALVLAVREDDAWRRSRYADIEAYTCVAMRERRQRVLSFSSLAAFLDQRSSQGRDRWRYSFRRPQRISWCWSVSPCHHMRRRGSRIVNSGNAPTSLGGTGSPSIASMPFRSRN